MCTYLHKYVCTYNARMYLCFTVPSRKSKFFSGMQIYAYLQKELLLFHT